MSQKKATKNKSGDHRVSAPLHTADTTTPFWRESALKFAARAIRQGVSA